MDRERWDRVQAIFHRAAEMNEAERSTFLGEACGEDQSLTVDVQRMLAEDARASLLDRDVTEVAEQVLDDPTTASLKELGPYRIVKLLGEGGMGVVYLAERKDLGNQVAIKILRDGWLSPARRQRFLIEQRTLAQLNHPSIARLYDANTLSDGTPWFVMEYVDGVPATEYCSRRNCSADERLKLIRAVAEAVEYAHGHGVIHRDLKPSNILVRDDGSVRLLDFGIAKQLDASGRPLNHTRTAFRSLTLAYASPEQIRGEAVSKSTDVYSLGVVLYELLTGRLPFDLTGKTTAEAERMITTEEPVKPSEIARRPGDGVSWADLDALCLTAMHKDPQRRYSSAGAVIREIDRYLNGEPLDAHRDSWRSGMARFARRNVVAISAAAALLAVIAAAVGLTAALSRKAPTAVRAQTVAVLPLVNGTADRSLDFLSLALADEISRTLGYARSLSVRPPEADRKFDPANLDMRKEGRELRAATVVSGRFMKEGDKLQISLNLTDVANNRLMWSDVFDVPAANMIVMQARVASKTRRAMAPFLGVSEFATDNPPTPKNEKAYQLYLRAAATPGEISTDSEIRQQRIDMLNQSVALDPSYAPAWELLANYYLAEGWFGHKGQAAMARFRELADKVIAMDPENATLRAGLVYYWGTVGKPDGKAGGMSRGEAYRAMEDLIRRRPDSARLHFLASWILRDAGSLAEAARECDTSVLIDAQDAGARSCGVTFMLLGDYKRAFDYLDLDRTSEVSRAVSIDVLVRQDKVAEALRRAEGKVPPWGSYNVLVAYLQHRPAAEIAALAREQQPATDPEVNFFSAAHLSYAGQTDAALTMLKRTIDAGYCSVPGIDSDPFFANVRAKPEFPTLRSAGQKCQEEFLRQRNGSR